VAGESAWNAPEGSGDGDVALIRDGKVYRIGPDLLALRDRYGFRSGEDKGFIGRDVYGAVHEGRGFADRYMSRFDGERSIAVQIRELHANLAAAQRDVRHLTKYAVR
jgi:hypothetical protein